MIAFFSANLEKKVNIRVKGTVAETYGAFGPQSLRLVKQIGIKKRAFTEEKMSNFFLL